jgi:NDP-sugar pyrophosphorylase family protein
MTEHAHSRPWRAGVIAAGWGERLKHGDHTLKPLVPVGGLPLVERVLTSLAEVGPAEVVIIVNEASAAVTDHVASKAWPFAIRWIVETTSSSMHSFLRVIETLAAEGDEGPFLVSTVDTIAPPGAFRAFAAASRGLPADLVLAVTAAPSDDEKPLLVQLAGPERGQRGVRHPSDPAQGSDDLKVMAIGEAARGARLATAGYYSVRSTVLRDAESARREGLGALRLFLERLLHRGYRLAAVEVAAGVDVDRPGDIRSAEALLRQVGA